MDKIPLFYGKISQIEDFFQKNRRFFLQESQIFCTFAADFKIIMPEGKKMQHFHPQHSLVVGGNAMPLEDFFNGDIESLL